MPLMMPLAIDGAAPSTTTNVTVPWPSWNKMMASGTHATDGIVCRPVIIEPIAAQDLDARDGDADDAADDDREEEP